MAPLAITEITFARQDEIITVQSGQDVASARRGKYMYVNAAGKAVLGAGGTAGTVGGAFRGLAMSNQNSVGDAVTLLQKGIVELGGVLDGADIGAPVYVADVTGGNSGLLTLVAGESAQQAIVGWVYPIWEGGITLKKVLFVDVTGQHVAPSGD